jgi:hypothetical protein
MPKPFRAAAGVCLGLAVAAGCTPSPSGGPLARPAKIATEPEDMHRIYDFTPASDANPVLARVSGTPVEIPLSELQAFLRAEVNDEERGRLDAEGKRRKLDRLIDDHLLLWDAYAKRADQGARATQMLENTKKMLLGEFLTKEEVDDKSKSNEQHEQLTRTLRDRLFSRASVVVSNEVHAELKKKAAARAPKLEDLPADLAAQPIARYRDIAVTAGDVWRRWVGEPPDRRPDLTKPEGLTELLKRELEDVLKVEEALARGIDRQHGYRVKVQENRAAITRMWFQDQATRETQERMKAPDIEGRLRQWYKERLTTRYTYKDEKGQDKVVVYDDEKESIRNDYFDHLRDVVRDERAQRLRQGHEVEVDERLVAGA